MNLIIFDIDDTLTKSEDQHQLAFVESMKEFRILKINQNWKDYLHHTDSYILKENYIRNLSKPFDFQFIDRFEIRMTEHILKLSKVSEIKGASSMIEALIPNAAYGFAFATGSLLKPALLKLNQAGINYDPKLVVGSNRTFDREGIVSEAIQRAKEFYKVESFKEIVSIGDGIWDLNASKNLGIHFVGLGLKNILDFNKMNVKYHLKDWTHFNLERMEKTLDLSPK